MDGWALIVGVLTLSFIYMGERFKAGSYLWLGALFAIILALRMETPLFYMATAGVLGVLGIRTFMDKDDVRSDEDN